jgi:hypothetical protein
MKRLIMFVVALLAGVFIISASGLLYLRHCEWSPEAAARYATEHAEKKSVGMCALYVRKAIIAGGIPLYVGGDAWSYKYTLPILNFHQVGKMSEREVGDIVVFQPIGGRKYGHIAIWNGKQWVSDFKQRNLIVHSDYLDDGCEYAIYRRDR